MSAVSLAVKYVGVAAHHTSTDDRIQVPISTSQRALRTNVNFFCLFLGIPTGMNVWLCYFSRSGQLAHVVHSLIKASLENWTVVRLVLWPVLCPHMGDMGWNLCPVSLQYDHYHATVAASYGTRDAFIEHASATLLFVYIHIWAHKLLKAASFHAELRARGLFNDLLYHPNE